VASLTEIAEVAGVSVATVSRVLSGSAHPVSEPTRERVVRAADVLGFHPNMLARGLVTNRSHTIGAIVHDISDPYFAEIVRGLEDSAHEHRYQLFISSSDRDPERELAYVRAFLSHRVDAIVFAGGGFDDAGYQRELDALLGDFELRNAVVRLSPRGDGLPFLAPDNEGGAAAMTAHLLGLGHREIGWIDGPPGFPPSVERAAGYRRALREAGLHADPELIETGHFTEEGGGRAAAALVGRRPGLTALFAANDLMAFGALRELQGRDVDVPGDVSVAGFDDIRMASHLHPSLSTVRVPMYQLGQDGFFLAMKLLTGERPVTRRLAVTLQLRESTGSPPGTPD
jgi:LacI family transcriptional regulator, galactose operon repressor